MSPRKQCEHFANELDALIRRTIDEYDLTYYEVVGILQCATFEITHEGYIQDQLDDDDDILDDPDDEFGGDEFDGDPNDKFNDPK